jgi:AAHS family 4-hydroxybenzoate transporter-like MFS transporter
LTKALQGYIFSAGLAGMTLGCLFIAPIADRIGREEIDELPELQPSHKASVKTLFNKEYKSSTIRLWIGVFFGFMTLYTLISWVPSIATDSGMPFKLATYVGTMLNVGAFIGSTGIGWLASHFKLKRLIFTFFIISFVIMVIYGSLPLSNAMVFIMIFLIGIFVQGGFNGYWPATARVYNTEVRATGIGWALGAGRFGAIAGPAFFGILSDMNLSVASLFVIFSVPLVISGIAVYNIPSKNLR